MDNEVQEIEPFFTFKGDLFTRVDKTEKGYIYERDHAGTLYYEVFQIKETEILLDFDSKIGSGQFKHKYPNDEAFGRWAWCFKENLFAAILKLENL